jgi:hypothetical protein
MSSQKSRRDFLVNLGLLAAAFVLPAEALASTVEPPLYPPIDLSYFDKPIPQSLAGLRVGYHAITWGGNDQQAVSGRETEIENLKGEVRSQESGVRIPKS